MCDSHANTETCPKVEEELDEKTLKRLHHKLFKACHELGLNMIEVASLVKINSLPDIACWGVDKSSGEEFIYVNPNTLKLPVQLVELVLRHEILHASGYSKVVGARNQELVNLVLDVAINYIIYRAYPKKMVNLSERLYDPKTRETILALVQCHLGPEMLVDPNQGGRKDPISDLWREIWTVNEIPSPTALYYKIIMQIPKSLELVMQMSEPFCGNGKGKENDQIKLRGHLPKPKEEKQKDNGEAKPSKFDKMAGNVMDRARDEAYTSRIGPYDRKLYDSFNKSKSEFFDIEQVGKKSADAENVKRMIERMRLLQQLDETAAKMFEAMGGKANAQLYPLRLTRFSLMQVALGITKYIPIFWNRVPESRKPKLAIYIDTSPSMDRFKEYEVYLIDQLKEYFPTKIFVFAGSVAEAELDKFAKGEYPSGNSTSFDAVVEHFLTMDYEACLMFTDGESAVSEANIKKFQERRGRMFPIYFSDGLYGGGPVTSNLDGFAEQVSNITTKELELEEVN